MDKVYYREMHKDDLSTWEKLAEPDFLPEDFCDAEYLLSKDNAAKGWVLLNEQEEWIGCFFISLDFDEYNPNGIHFLESWVAPKFRNKGYAKYLMKIGFDNAKGFRKSACINPNNISSIRVATKYGFQKICPHKTWDVYICDDNYYPKELEDLVIHPL